MRKIAATYVFPCNQPPIKNGIIHLDDAGIIREIVGTKGIIQEEAGLEYYSGILTPGFVVTQIQAELSAVKERQMWFSGIAVAGNKLKHFLSSSTKHKIHYHHFQDSESLNTLKKTNAILELNTQNLAEEISKLKILKERNTRVIFSLKEATSILPGLIDIQQQFPEITLQELITWSTINGAKTLGIDKTFGSLEKGKQPGINLITGVDFKQMKLTSNSKIKRLV